jgi:Zn ribbon nucleic-acid-binding protein
VSTTITKKKPKTGGEIDAYCTKCKLDLTHRIIAMVGDAVKKVECKTCGSHHLYRRPKTERDAADARREARAAERASAGPRSAGERATAAAKAERLATQQWEHAIAGQPANAFKAYRISLSFGQGELIRHPKFGDGFVSRVIDRGKVEILFKDGPRTMAHGQQV